MKKRVIVLGLPAFLLTGCGTESKTVGVKGTADSIGADSLQNADPKNGETRGAENQNETAKNQSQSFELAGETEHFNIYCLEKDKGCLKDLGEGLEAAYSKVTKDLDCPLEYKVEVTVYPDITSLQSAIGYARGTGQDDYITAATIGKRIYITSPLNPGPARDYEHMIKSSTFHEFTHVVINKIASSDSWPTHVPRWLNEGIASYEGGPPMPVAILEQQVSRRVRSDQIPSFANLASYGQDFITSGGYFFTLPAGAFLVEKYGFEKVKQLLLAPDNYKGVFGKSEQEIWNEWVEYLNEKYG